jgi:hypothetical protein
MMTSSSSLWSSGIAVLALRSGLTSTRCALQMAVRNSGSRREA